MEQRSLYRVWVVDPRGTGKVLMAGACIIAESEGQAMMKAGVAKVAEDAGLELEQVDAYAEHVGKFIRAKKGVQEVKIISEDKK